MFYGVWCYLLVVIVPVKGKGVAHEIAGVFVESVFLKQKEFQCLPTEKDTESNIVIKKIWRCGCCICDGREPKDKGREEKEGRGKV